MGNTPTDGHRPAPPDSNNFTFIHPLPPTTHLGRRPAASRHSLTPPYIRHPTHSTLLYHGRAATDLHHSFSIACLDTRRKQSGQPTTGHHCGAKVLVYAELAFLGRPWHRPSISVPEGSVWQCHPIHCSSQTQWNRADSERSRLSRPATVPVPVPLVISRRCCCRRRKGRCRAEASLARCPRRRLTRAATQATCLRIRSHFPSSPRDQHQPASATPSSSSRTCGRP